MLEINEKVYAIYHPQKGYFPTPIQGTILEASQFGYIVSGLDYRRGDEAHDRWFNDFYGNCIESEYLFKSYEEAVRVLVAYFQEKKMRLSEEVSKVETIIHYLEKSFNERP